VRRANKAEYESMSHYKLFIQSNKKQLLGALVAKHSFLSKTQNPQFEVEILMAEDQQSLAHREGQIHLREGRKVVWRNDLQSFTPLRFLPPQKMNFTGRAIVIDPDVFALTDCMELFSMDMQGKSIWCRKITEKTGKTYWATSVMLLDCEMLSHWNWDQQIEEMFELKRDYRTWMSLHYEDQNTIGELAEEWNHYDTLNASTKFLHNTGRLTQPWKTGLPIDFSYSHLKQKKLKSGLVGRIKRVFGIEEVYSNKAAAGLYKQHPDPQQERFFMSLLNECIQSGVITPSFIQSEIDDGNVRKDIFKFINGTQDEARL